MALVQIRIRCDERFRECPRKCFGCSKAVVIEVKNLSGKPPPDKLESKDKPQRREFRHGPNNVKWTGSRFPIDGRGNVRNESRGRPE